MDDFRSNAVKERETAKASEPVRPKAAPVELSGNVTKAKKKSVMSKVVRSLLSENIDNIGSYLIFDVVVPALKDGLYTVMVNGAGAIFGKTRNSENRERYHTSSSYYSTYRRQQEGPTFTRVATNVYDYDEYGFDERGDAEIVKDIMQNLAQQQDWVSVAEYYDVLKMAASTTDTKWGWRDLRSIYVEQRRDGRFYIHFPRPEAIN
jgi:hypothetical protein